ncbi:hypothetical protein [Actinomycetospora sp. CA-084318]|uniref:hypothetical protein n=1 Tax=Actinomycetospora sp. CA-084318 TaxID=3239892 RepID=UPI003D9721C9
METDEIAAALAGDPALVGVELVDLRRASALLRFRAARDGLSLIETRPEFLGVLRDRA